MRSYLEPFIILLALALFALRVESQDLVEGRDSTNHVLIHSSRFVGSNFEWRGDNLISRFEVRNRDQSNWIRFNRIGGVRSSFLQVWSDEQQVNADVFIYSQPQDQAQGRTTNESAVVGLVRLTGAAPYNLTFWSPYNAVRVELVDLTNGTGSRAVFGHLMRRSISATITSEMFRGRFDYAMTVHGEPVRPNHFTSGRLLSTSVQVNSDVITAAQLTADGWFNFPLPNHTYNFVRLTDMTDGTAGRVVRVVLTANARLRVLFEPLQNTTFLMQVHGTPIPQLTQQIHFDMPK